MSYVYNFFGLVSVFLICAWLVNGCSDNKTPEPSQKSTGQQIVEDMTGISNIKAGQKARSKIEAISSQKSNELEEVTGQNK
jgi:hypothetical protein